MQHYYHENFTITDEYLAHCTVIPLEMTTWISFYSSWTPMIKVILSHAIFSSHKELMVEAHTKHTRSSHPHEHMPSVTKKYQQ